MTCQGTTRHPRSQLYDEYRCLDSYEGVQQAKHLTSSGLLLALGKLIVGHCQLLKLIRSRRATCSFRGGTGSQHLWRELNTTAWCAATPLVNNHLLFVFEKTATILRLRSILSHLPYKHDFEYFNIIVLLQSPFLQLLFAFCVMEGGKCF